MEAAAVITRSSIGPYRLIAKIGEGGMGTVYLAKQDGPAGFAKLAVVKELRAEMAQQTDFMEMFLNEARLAARLTHPNVVHTYGANEEDGRLYIAMEYLDGQPWVRVRHRLWANRSLPLSLHLHVLAETLAGLHYAHELRHFDGTPLQVVHCDVSPQNVFVTYDGQVKIVDFGVAKAVTSNSTSDPELFVGKLSYAAPEQVLRHSLDRRADIYAVGVMLWEALTGRRFVEGMEKGEILQRRVAGSEPRVRQVVPSVPRVLSDMCDRALCLDPEDRYSTAAEFRAAILDYLKDTSQRTEDDQLGKLVGAAFREERARVHRIIEENLSSPSGAKSKPVQDLGLGTDVPEDTLRADLSEFVSVSRLADDHALAEASVVASVRPPSKGTRKSMIGGVAAFVLALGISLYVFRPAEDVIEATPLATPSTEQPALAPGASPLEVEPTPAANEEEAPKDISAEQNAQEEAPPAEARQVQLTFSATPSSAKLAIDGNPLPSNPYAGPFDYSEELHVVTAEGDGLIPQEMRILFDRDRDLVFALAPVQAAVAHHRRRQGGGGPQANPSSSPPSSVPTPTTTATASSAAAPAAPKPPANSTNEDPSVNNPARQIYEEDPY